MKLFSSTPALQEFINRNLLLLMMAMTLAVGVLLTGCNRTAEINGRSELNDNLEETRASSDQHKADNPNNSQGDDSERAEVEADYEFKPEAVTNLRQTRAVWSWAGRKAEAKDDVDKLISLIDQTNLNVVILSVYNSGTAYFEPNHKRFPDQAERLPNMSRFSVDRYPDVLSYLLAVRDERRADDDPDNDFEVHAWFNVTQGGNNKNEEGWPRPDATESYMLHARFPEFKLKYSQYYTQEDEKYVNHRYASVHQPKFRAYLADLIAGLVEDYDVDGVHLDHIRAMQICFNDEPLDYPEKKFDYLGCQEDYKAWTRETYGQEYTLWEDTNGHNEIQDGGSGRVAAWQERAVNTLVKQIHDEVKAVNPDVTISAAVGLTNPDPEQRKLSIQGQVAWEWLDQGWLDAAFVMAYTTDTHTVIEKVQSFMDACQKESSRSKVFPGLATHNVDARYEPWTYLIIEQINATVYGNWERVPLQPLAHGVALFRADRLSDEAIKALSMGPFKEPRLPYWSEVHSSP